MRPIGSIYLMLKTVYATVGLIKWNLKRLEGVQLKPDTRHILRSHRNVLLLGGV
jgi:hypothetical protein